MKLMLHLQSQRSPVPGSAVRGFTLTELLTVVAIFSLLVAATVSSQIFGMRLYRISEAKLAVTADARGTLDRVRDEIRSGRLLYVGNGDSASFRLVADKLPQTGNALRICATTDTNRYVHYHLDAGNSCLTRTVSGDDSVEVIANHVTNQLVFRAEDFQGNVVTNSQNHRVIRMTLQFHRWEFPAARAGSDGLYESYQLQTRMARRATE